LLAEISFSPPFQRHADSSVPARGTTAFLLIILISFSAVLLQEPGQETLMAASRAVLVPVDCIALLLPFRNDGTAM